MPDSVIASIVTDDLLHDIDIPINDYNGSNSCSDDDSDYDDSPLDDSVTPPEGLMAITRAMKLKRVLRKHSNVLRDAVINYMILHRNIL